MKLTIQVDKFGQVYEATLKGVEYPFERWRDLREAIGTCGVSNEGVIGAVGDLVALLANADYDSEKREDALKLARWNKNVLDWKHIQPVTPLTAPMELA